MPEPTDQPKVAVVEPPADLIRAIATNPSNVRPVPLQDAARAAVVLNQF